jgi:hypothetical protein
MQMASSEAEFAENRATAQKASQQRDWAEKRLAAETERLSRLLEEVERERDNVKVRPYADDPNAGQSRAACGIVRVLFGCCQGISSAFGSRNLGCPCYLLNNPFIGKRLSETDLSVLIQL